MVKGKLTGIALLAALGCGEAPEPIEIRISIPSEVQVTYDPRIFGTVERFSHSHDGNKGRIDLTLQTPEGQLVDSLYVPYPDSTFNNVMVRVDAALSSDSSAIYEPYESISGEKVALLTIGGMKFPAWRF